MLFVALSSFAQDDVIPKNADGKYEFTEVVNVDSVSADKLYSNAKIFIVHAFKSGKDVTQLNDDNTKTVIGKANMHLIVSGLIGSAIDKWVNYTVTIQCKDGRYKYSFSDFVLEMIGTQYRGSGSLDDEKIIKGMLTKKQYGQMITKVSITIKTLIIDLKTTMAGKSAATKDF